ncbi:hypothetical protein [Streptomyces sp. NPDC001404]|uniref:hypothetical protein n=1 Tax=Streptomyces sp. NPDC001404 TaxID=3364571 RepID=UPI003690892D
MSDSQCTLTTGYITADFHLPNWHGLPSTAISRYLPGGWVLSDRQDRTDTRVRIQITTGPGHIETLPNEVTIHLTSSAAASPALGFTTYTAMERARQQRRMVTLHGSAAAHDRGAVVLLGHKAAGKTTTAFALARRGWSHAGDDLIVLGHDQAGLFLMPGKPTAAVRPQETEEFYRQKPLLDLRPVLTAGRTTVALIVRLTVHPHARPLAVPAAPFSSGEYLRLHENLARYISGLPTPVSGLIGAPYGVTWALDTPQCARWRTHLINRMERNRFFYVHAPTAEAAADLIEGLMP